MYPIPPNEHLVETRTCKHCSASFPITDKDMDFYSKVSPVFPSLPVKGGTDEERGGGGFGTGNQNPPGSPLDRGVIKYQIPPPTLCPDCRQQRRLSFRNERKLYKRKCDATGKEIVSCFSPASEMIVYDLHYWWGDTWDAIDHGVDYSGEVSFFDQIAKLHKNIPKRALMQGTHNVNSPFSNCVGECKNTYMIFASTNATDSYHSERISHSDNCMDCSSNPESTICYEIVDGIGNSRCFFSKEIQGCSDCMYCLQCTGCHDCFGCTNLTNASYQIYNKQYSPEDYRQEIAMLSKQKDIKNQVEAFWGVAIRRASNILGSTNATGDLITNSSDVHVSFSVKDGSDIRYSTYAYGGTHDIMDTYACVKNSSRIYESAVLNKESSNIIFSYDCWSHCNSLIYCLDCRSCSHCFGCTGLVGKSYCILNKQYTKEEYEVLVPKIIEKMMADGEWGEFFPSSMSPFGYNETVAQEYFPLSKGEAIEKGIFNWSDYEAPFPTIKKVIPASKLPDTIESIPDDILNWAIECEVSKKPFRIIKQELEFYRKHNLPIPRRHPDQRHLDRMALRNPRKLYERKCDKCSIDMITTYAPERPETVYCEKCYLEII